MDMLCLMFECDTRGVLMTGGEPWSDQEIAATISGETAEVLSCVKELLAKGVAQRDSRGAIFSRRLVRDEQTRQHYSNGNKNKGANKSANPTQTHTQIKRKCTEDEDEDENAVALEAKNQKPENLGANQPQTSAQNQPKCAENFDAEMWVQAILSSHPRPEWGQAAQAYVVEALIHECKTRKWDEKQAAEYLQARTQLFAQCFERWPEGEKKFVKGGTEFFEKKLYNQPEKGWARSPGKSNRYDEQRENLKRVFTDAD